MSESPFEQWYNGIVGFHINSERILDDLRSKEYSGFIDSEKLRKWMAVCWNNAIDAATNAWNEVDADDIVDLKENT